MPLYICALNTATYLYVDKKFQHRRKSNNQPHIYNIIIFELDS